LSEHYKVTIQSLVYEGGGFSRLPNGKAVFVPFVMPGEQVTVRLREEKRGFALADLVSVDAANAERIAPKCAHFGSCGGCHYQHIPYSLQLEYKKGILIEQFERMAGIQAPQVDQVIAAPESWHYRNTIQFQVNPEGRLCFAQAGDNSLFEVRECHLPMPAIGALWPQLAFESGSFSGRLEIRQNKADDVLLQFEGDRGEIPELESESSVSIVSLAGDDPVVLAGDDHLVIQLGGRFFRVSAGSFFQTNYTGAETLVQVVRDMVLERGCRKLLDVYCGAGLFSSFLAGDVEALAGIESSPSACRDFVVNLDEFDNVSLYPGPAENVLPDLAFKPDGVIIDPPRAGLRPKALQALQDMRPEFIVYVSCNPSTLARDTKRLLAGGYQLRRTVLVDMFPQTFHMETVALFEMS
jgi:23S rRNA (uracil1939-C5)-methyltransferase